MDVSGQLHFPAAYREFLEYKQQTDVDLEGHLKYYWTKRKLRPNQADPTCDDDDNDSKSSFHEVHKRNALSGGRDDRPQVSSLELLNTIQWN
jgi:hypothetical protein